MARKTPQQRVSKSQARQTRQSERRSHTTGGPVPGGAAAPSSDAISVNDIERANRLVFEPDNPRQRFHLRSLRDNPLTIALGPAGTGKTTVTCYFTADGVLRGRIKKVMLMRPPVALGTTKHETLPGDIFAKIAPWARPMLRKLEGYLGKARFEKMVKAGDIEVVPFTYLRGMEFEAGTLVILDEAQNCTIEQLEAWTTRIADGATVAILGDEDQHDMPGVSALQVLHELIDASDDIDCGIVEYLERDIKRGKLCRAFVAMWGRYKQAQTQTKALPVPAYQPPRLISSAAE